MRLLVVGLLLLSLTACGTTSKIQPVGLSGASVAGAESPNPYRKYETVAVLDFRNATGKNETMTVAATSRFADWIADELKKSNSFSEVLREKPEGEALIVTGEITRYEEGQAMLRFFIGMGAGSSYFDATVRLSDNLSGAEIGLVKVDKNSWPLGGAVASAQSADNFMRGAAKSIAKSLKEQRASSTAIQ